MQKTWAVELLKLIRWQNLLMIAFTQYLVRYFVIKPVFFNYKIEHSLSEWQFALFVLATVCIATAGYIINDYFDVEIDRINKPDKMVIGNFISKRAAFQLHLALNIIGAALGFVVAWFAGNVKLGFIFIVVGGLLWFYAKTFKKIFLLGNLMVAIITALTVLVPAYFEKNLFVKDDLLATTANREIMTIVLAYTFFAFLSTLIRELIKDIEDIEGDREYGGKTVAVVLGARATKGIIASLCVMLIAFLFVVQRSFFAENSFIKISYILVALQLPLASLIFYVIPAEGKEDFGKISGWMKVIMLFGITSMAVFHYTA